MSAKLTAALLIGTLLGTAACAQTAGSGTPGQSAQADGSSPARAIVINENDTMRGIAAENRWIAANMPGCRKTGQALIQENGGIYDLIRVRCADGQTRAVFFDIRSFFGRIDGKSIGG